jgi:hypothetical protein
MSTLHPSLDVPIVCAEKCDIKSKLDYTKSDANLVKSHVGILMCNVDLPKVQSTYDTKSDAGLVKSNFDMIKSNCGCGNFNLELVKSNVYTIKSNVKLAGLMSKK